MVAVYLQVESEMFALQAGRVAERGWDMVILDEPYASPQLLEWLERSQHPVLRNAFARRMALSSGRALHLVDAEEAAARLDAGERVYTNSENALAWISEHVENDSLTRAIATFKDKVAMRTLLSQLDKGFFFRACSADELSQLDFAELSAHAPFVVKPARGFCSMGVHVVNNQADWQAALADFAENASVWASMYPDSVVAGGDFILEQYITGQEFALDAFFDEAGAAHVLNVLRHDFAGPDDTSDRMYTTSAVIVREHAPAFEAWLTRVNSLVGARNFPVHVEVRVGEDGVVRPIEFNPLRFAGLGGTDVAQHAFGFRTYEAFLAGALPDFSAAFEYAGDCVYTMSLLNPPAGVTGEERFDYQAFSRRFARVLELRRFDVPTFGCYGFLFVETDDGPQGRSELDYLLHTDLREFIDSPDCAGSAVEADSGDAEAGAEAAELGDRELASASPVLYGEASSKDRTTLGASAQDKQ